MTQDAERISKIVDSFIEVTLPEPDNFLKVKEALTRMGTRSTKPAEMTLIQSCHILQKKSRYYIVHFKELFLLDNRLINEFTDSDRARRNHIAELLEKWGLVGIVSPEKISSPSPETDSHLRIVPFKKKKEWFLKAQHHLGTKKRKVQEKE